VQSSDEDASVRHLRALGYTDPVEVVARTKLAREQLEADLQRALTSYQQGNCDEAIAALVKLVEADREWIAPHQIVADIYYRAGRLIDAHRHLTWLTEHGIENPRLALIEGAIAIENRALDSAADALEYAAFVDAALPGVNTLLGDVYRRRGQLEAAEATLEAALAQNAADAQAFDCLAAIRLQQRQYSEAAHFALESLQFDIQLARAHYHLGVALLHLGSTAEAVTALETSSRINPLSAAPYFWLYRIAHESQPERGLEITYCEKAREILGTRRALRLSRNPTM
jgi:predicted Zn-dependent protease